MKIYETFFKLYADFTKIDAISSLHNNGRHRDLIFFYFKLFTAIVEKNESKQKELISRISEIQISYVKENKSLSVDIYDMPYSFNSGGSQEVVFDFSEAFSNFYHAYFLYDKHRRLLSDDDFKKLYLKNISDFHSRFFNVSNEDIINIISSNVDTEHLYDGTILKQSLMEFNNAISHLCSCFIGKADKAPNTSRAMTHINRGALDFYKAIIRDLNFVNRNINLEKLKDIRKNEFQSIGTQNGATSKVINSYKEYITEILNN